MEDPCSRCSQEQTLERAQTPPPDQPGHQLIRLIPRVPRTQQMPGSPNNVSFPEMSELLNRPPKVPSPPSSRQEGQLSDRDDDGAEFDFNVVARLSQWADENLCLIRVPARAGRRAGPSLDTRLRASARTSAPEWRWWVSSYSRKVLSCSSDIPEEFIKNNVKLQGRLRRITENGLKVEHTPITVPLISRWRKQPYGVLLVKIAGVELTEAGWGWLQKELKPSQKLWFQLLAKENSALLCLLLVEKGRFFNVCLNEEILRRGLGRTVLIKELDHESKIFWTVHKNLLKAELKAMKKGEGLWKEQSEIVTYVKKFKGSWREIWCEDGQSVKKGVSLDTVLKTSTYYQMLKRRYEKYKEND
ncbi:protein C3orf33 homolog isoform X3 [Monodelphis domestica]|uniref:protein C3orf33 homolog isoform X3 n=1 Tax=Monodelphis domestica TaxID=13616 RepID=UPI000443456F|nr:protein C3orf33 homolog isoform X3 [Monodelphis domestica]